MLIGYARVSTDDQRLDLQIDALTNAGVERDWIYEEHVSGAKTPRPQMEACLKALRKDDVLVVYRLDRLGRSLRELIDVVEKLFAAHSNGQQRVGRALHDANNPVGSRHRRSFAGGQFGRALRGPQRINEGHLMQNLTIDEVRMLAEIERLMDSGEQPFVVVDGGRLAVQSAVMDELGLVSGQTISPMMALAVSEASLASLQARADLERLSQ